MKISLTTDERKHLGALIKVLAVNTKDQPGALAFWRSVYDQLAPNRPVADLRRKEIEALLAVCQGSLHTLKKMRKHDEEASLRADYMIELLSLVASKIEARMKEVEENG